MNVPERAVVIGATGGIGRAVVRQLAALGTDVHGIARRRDALDELAGETGCHTHAVDVLDGPGMAAVFEAAGDVDVMVFAAGVGGPIKPFHELSREHIDGIVGPNVVGLLNSVHAALPRMVRLERGHVVVIGSISGMHPVASATYAASKGAAHAFTRSLPLSLAGTGVRVTEVVPGRIATDCVPLANPDVDVRALEPDQSALLQPDDVADAVTYAVTAPMRVHVGLIELVPASQVLGGPRFVTVPAVVRGA